MTGADLFHVTRLSDADVIAREGLRVDADELVVKQTGGPVDDPMIEESRDVRARRELDNLLDSAQSHSGSQHFPAHSRSVFFWTRESRARRAARNTQAPSAIVGVDSDEIPCRCVVASIDISDYIYNELYDLYGDFSEGTPPRDLYDDAVEYWEGAEWYTGQEDSRVEVFCGCDIPLRAIEYIEDPVDRRILYRPDVAPTLWDFL